MGPPPAAQGPTHRTNPRAVQPGWLSTETAAANREADWPSGHRGAFEQRGPRSEHADPKMHKMDDFGRVITLRSYGTKTNGEVRQEVAMRTRRACPPTPLAAMKSPGRCRIRPRLSYTD